MGSVQQDSPVVDGPSGRRSHRPLDAGYTAEVDHMDEAAWYQLLSGFRDANIYQTWAYALVRAGRDKMSHLVLRRDGAIVAIAQSRLVTVPVLGAGIAYVMWGPLYRRKGQVAETEVFRQIIRALRNEYVSRRGLLLRVYPVLFDEHRARYLPVLEAEGLSQRANAGVSSTIIMDLSQPLDELHASLRQRWGKELRIAERKPTTVREGDSDELFGDFISIYEEMVARKRFRVPNDINEFREIQRVLPAELKMRLMLCTSSCGHHAGLVASVIGDTAIYLYGATSRIGLKTYGSYLLQSELIKTLKGIGAERYDLHGINPDANPGVYKFKKSLAGETGREVAFLGQFECASNWISPVLVRIAEGFRAARRVIGA